MKNCPNCQTPVNPKEPYCPACGEDLTAVDASATAVSAASSADNAQTATQGADANASSEPALATLTHGTQSIALREGSSVTIARKDTEKCTPTLPIDSDGVSSSPVTVKVENGVITVATDPGMSVGIRVVKYLKPGETMVVAPGEMLMLGAELVNVG